MLTIISLFFLFVVFGSVIKLAVKMTWGLTKIIFGIVLLPLILLALIFSGLFLLAIPILLVLGLLTLGKLLVKA